VLYDPHQQTSTEFGYTRSGWNGEISGAVGEDTEEDKEYYARRDAEWKHRHPDEEGKVKL
jgi:hypothetical protein